MKKPNDKTSEKPRKVSLRKVCFAGLALLILSCGIFLAAHYMGSRSENLQLHAAGFNNLLNVYDMSLGAIEEAGGVPDFVLLNLQLDRLELEAESAENWLSVLKRRRNLAALDPAYNAAFMQSAFRAAQVFPWSAPVAAVAASAVIQNYAETPLAVRQQSHDFQRLNAIIPAFTNPLFDPLRISLHVLMGDFENMEEAFALSLPGFSDIGAIAPSPQDEPAALEALAINLIVLEILNNRGRENIGAAGGIIQNMLDLSPSINFITFAAEYHYDFGDALFSAELFSRVPGLWAQSRQADALWLGGQTESARALWMAMDEALPNDERVLYNLAATAGTEGEAVAFLERLTALNLGTDGAVSGASDSLQQTLAYAFIRYSRMLDAPRAIAVLQSAPQVGGFGETERPLIDLEVRRRLAESEELGRQMAETWMLLERHGANEEIYQWAAWFFDFQQNRVEMDMLFWHIERQGLYGDWALFHQAGALMQTGDLDSAMGLLRGLAGQDAGWYVFANIGRILEATDDFNGALAYYGIAFARAGSPQVASRLQQQKARCFIRIGLADQAREALEYAIVLDPQNNSARFELGQFPPPLGRQPLWGTRFRDRVNLF